MCAPIGTTALPAASSSSVRRCAKYQQVAPKSSIQACPPVGDQGIQSPKSKCTVRGDKLSQVLAIDVAMHARFNVHRTNTSNGASPGGLNGRRRGALGLITTVALRRNASLGHWTASSLAYRKFLKFENQLDHPHEDPETHATGTHLRFSPSIYPSVNARND